MELSSDEKLLIKHMLNMDSPKNYWPLVLDFVSIKTGSFGFDLKNIEYFNQHKNYIETIIHSLWAKELIQRSAATTKFEVNKDMIKEIEGGLYVLATE